MAFVEDEHLVESTAWVTPAPGCGLVPRFSPLATQIPAQEDTYTRANKTRSLASRQ